MRRRAGAYGLCKRCTQAGVFEHMVPSFWWYRFRRSQVGT